MTAQLSAKVALRILLLAAESAAQSMCDSVNLDADNYDHDDVRELDSGLSELEAAMRVARIVLEQE